MQKNYGMYQGYNVEGTAEVKITPEMQSTQESSAYASNYGFGSGAGYGYMNSYMPCAMPGIVCPPVYECPEERCIHREICHEVPHVCPINTRIINHHIYKHTYSPCYTCTEENVVSNVGEGCCGRF